MDTDNAETLAPREPSCPLVGRERELDVLADALRATSDRNETRIVTLVGPAGIGKTRLITEFVDALARDPTKPRVFSGSARNAAVSFSLFARLFRSRFNLERGMDPDLCRAALKREVAAVLEPHRVSDAVTFLGQLLGLPEDESPLTRAMSDDPHEVELARRAVLKSFFEADAHKSPLVLVFEDLHEAHEDAMSLLRYLLEYLTGQILVLCSGRDGLVDWHEDWGRVGERRHTVLELGTLGDRDAQRVAQSMIARYAGSAEAPAAVVSTACAFARGNPGLIAQMIDIYKAEGVIEEVAGLDGTTEFVLHADKLDKAHLPATVEDAIAARIASLDDEERTVLEHAASMGGTFWSGALVALARMGMEAPDLWVDEVSEDVARIERLLGGLSKYAWIERRAGTIFPGSVEYAWMRSEERDAITAGITSEMRMRYNGVIADWMEHQPGVRTNEERIAALARHREQAGEAIQAGLAYLEAARVARRRYANGRACEYYQRGLELLGDTHDGARIDALHAYGDVLQSMGYVDDAMAAFRGMLTLAYRLDMKPKGGAAHNRIGRLFREMGVLDEGERHLTTALALFEASGDERGVASTIDDVGKIAWLKGEYVQALQMFRDGLARRRKLGDRRSIALSLNNLGLALQDSGQFRDALDAFEQSLQLRRDVGDLVGVVTTLNNLGTIAEERRNYQKALTLFEEALDVAQQIGDRNKIALVLTNIGTTHYRSGEPEKAIGVLMRAEGLCDELGDRLKLAETLRALGKAYLMQSDLDKARECIGRAVDLFASVRSKVHLAAALRTLGEITAAGGWGSAHTTSAREYFDRAVAIFEQSGNEVELARTFKTYARFLQRNPELAKDEQAQREATAMESRADQIFGRLERTSSSKSETPPPPN
ncbi:MAG: tetratricopeptide repeat protein [Polyangiaceae bacterium]|nr:tetratricopeptide repeat protein [Polyangiaceae bacterium]